MTDTSPKQIAANKDNAQKSTGPKTPDGKAIAKYNALKHGLLAQETLLPTEDANTLMELGKQLREELKPVGQLEHFLVERILTAMWRIKRLHTIETGMFTWESVSELASRIRDKATEYEKRESIFGRDLSMETVTILNKKKHAEILAEAEEMEKIKEEDKIVISLVFAKDAMEKDVMEKIIRYESALERSFIKTLHELQRVQANRLGAGTPPPAALDVDITK